MSSFDPSDPFDNGQPWQNVHTQGSRAIPAPENSPSTIPAAFAPPTALAAPPANPSPTTPSSSPEAPHAPHQTQGPQSSQEVFEDEPPSYEATIIKDLPQIHDNYDHLRGPPGSRGVDLKTRIPLDSTPSSYYQGGGANGSGSGSASASASASRPGPSVPHASPDHASYGAIQSPPFSPVVQPSAPYLHHQQTPPHRQGGIAGQTALGPDEDDIHHTQDVDRLLGTGAGNGHHEDQDEPDSHWSIAGDGKAWMSLCYLLLVLFPWALFCFIWTLVTVIVAPLTLIIPPFGYLFVVATVTSWRALARADLAISQALVSPQIQEKHPNVAPKVYVPPPPGPVNRFTGRARRSRNIWHRGSIHFKAVVKNKHSVKTLFYFLIWKMFFALPIFIVVLVFSILTVPFMICLLPSLLIMSRALINWQYRWAVLWVADKPAPIALP